MMVTIKKVNSKDVEIPRVKLIAFTDDKSIFIQLREGMHPGKSMSIPAEDWDGVIVSKMA